MSFGAAHFTFVCVDHLFEKNYGHKQDFQSMSFLELVTSKQA